MSISIRLTPEILDIDNYDSATLASFAEEIKVASIHYLKEDFVEFSVGKFPMPDSLVKPGVDALAIITTKDGQSTIHKFELENAIQQSDFNKAKHRCLRKNFGVVYEDKSKDKELIFALLDTLKAKSDLESAQPIGTKNLIYFTIGNDPNYIPLLEKCVHSLNTHANSLKFDILILTTESYLTVLSNSEVLQAPNIKIHALNTRRHNDGVFVSMNKLRVFEYPEIGQYRNILFLDCDVLAISDITPVFKALRNTDTLYTVTNPTVTMQAHNGIYHGLDTTDLSLFNKLVAAEQKPFNAGQFMFINSARMKKHFSNVLWLSKVWPGTFFFEQCFMNRYFCGYELTNSVALTKLFNLIAVNGSYESGQLHDDSAAVLHFIAPPMRPLEKLTFINSYANANKLRI